MPCRAKNLARISRSREHGSQDTLVGVEGGHRHHAADANSRELFQAIRGRCPIGTSEPAFRFFSDDIHLKERLYGPVTRGPYLMDCLGQPKAVERMNHVELCDGLGFVPLQMPDQVPSDRNGGDFDFRKGFLNPVLSHIAQARVPRRLNRVRTVRLGDGNDRNALAVPASPSGTFDCLTNVPKPVREVRKRHKP